ncbi:hypothetical protein BDB00DRAFT_888678, partial [Zychaea mexicana]|uniref:uncharacterized protein n=1 Tax=Zychaea mexicana TaxID=64656 RepID=UPI0022FEA7F2
MSTTTNNIDVSGAYFSTWPSPVPRPGKLPRRNVSARPGASTKPWRRSSQKELRKPRPRGHTLIGSRPRKHTLGLAPTNPARSLVKPSTTAASTRRGGTSRAPSTAGSPLWTRVRAPSVLTAMQRWQSASASTTRICSLVLHMPGTRTAFPGRTSTRMSSLLLNMS